ncbi:MAG: hypothetical protein ICV60_00355 [Pyrinomonadaceae bacterium]|nr:hypothetical protein [Pyrinomonadaceae bacterium]
MKNILTAILVVISLLMLDVRAGICQQSNPAKPSTTGEVSKQPTQSGQGASSNAGQTATAPAPLDDKARKIRRMVQKIGVAGRLTLYLKNGEEFYGSVVSYDEESLRIAEIDLKQVVTVQYRNIKRIREDYGKRDPLTGQRSNPPKGFKIGLSVGLLFVALALPIIVLASAKD